MFEGMNVSDVSDAMKDNKKTKLVGISFGNGNPTNEKCMYCDHWKPASERPHRPFDGCEKYDEEDPDAVCSCFVRSQKSMDDDPTIPVNRGVAGVYMPEPNEKTRARVGLVQAAERYIATTNCDFDVFDISASNGNVYQLRITKMR